MKDGLDLSIFRDYDIRGIYPKQLNENTFYILGKAIATYLKADKIAVGRDARLSSPSLSTSLIQGILEQDVDVVDLGMISTEMHYFASGFYQFPANIIVSASHNPSEYNGLKIVKKGVVSLHGGFGLPEIKKLVQRQDFPKAVKKGEITKMKILDAWINHALKFVDKSILCPLTAVIDAGNGMGGISWEKLIGKLPVKIIPLYFEPNGHFPHHLPDPLKEENLIDLKKKIALNKADLGLALDGDADRLLAIDEKGQVISGTILSAILAAELLEKKGPAPVLYNVVCGRIVHDTIKKYRGTPIRVRVGHSFIKEKMRKYQALFAGEHSGHFYFRDNYYADSSLIAGLILLEHISKRSKKVSQIVSYFDKYKSSGELNFKVKNSDDILKKIEQKLRDANSCDHLDGLSVWYNDWWFSLRASKTEPLLRLNIEADNREILSEKQKMLEKLLISFGSKKV